MSTPLDDQADEDANKLHEEVRQLVDLKNELEGRLLRALDQNRLLRAQLCIAIAYVENMRIVPGGVRDLMRRNWRALVEEPAP